MAPPVLHPRRMARAFRILAALVLAIGLVSGPAGAAPLRTFYVDPAGNDSAAGSATEPWRTLQKAANTVRAGDLVIVRAGHYAGLYLTTSGTATDPITFHGEPGAIVDTQNPTTQDGINLEGAELRHHRGVHRDRRAARGHPLGAEPSRDHPRQHRRPERALGHPHRLQRRHPHREQRHVALAGRARHLRLEQRRSAGHPPQRRVRQPRQRHPHERRREPGRRRHHLGRARRGQHHLTTTASAAAPASTATACRTPSSATTSSTTTTPAASPSTRSTPRSRPATTGCSTTPS